MGIFHSRSNHSLTISQTVAKIRKSRPLFGCLDYLSYARRKIGEASGDHITRKETYHSRQESLVLYESLQVLVTAYICKQLAKNTSDSWGVCIKPNLEGQVIQFTTLKSIQISLHTTLKSTLESFVFKSVKMTYSEPPTIEAEVDFKAEGAGKPCKTVRNNLPQSCLPNGSSPPQSFGIHILAN